MSQLLAPESNAAPKSAVMESTKREVEGARSWR